MMEDQLEDYVHELRRNGLICEIVEKQIKISKIISNYNIDIWCELGSYFPYEFPKVYIDMDTKDKLPSIPHLAEGGCICVFDEEKAMPNFNNPQGLVLETVEKAFDIIEKGIRGKNKIDFMDEFLAYWSAKKLIKAQIFIEDLSVPKIAYWCFLKKEIIISDTKERLVELSEAIGQKINQSKIQEGYLVPIHGEKIVSIPKNDLDIIKMVESASDYNRQYNTFMQRNIKNGGLIIFNQIVSEQNILAGWIHWKRKIPKGFRKGHVNLKIAYSGNQNRGTAVAVENCHQNRLFVRGGDGLEIKCKKVSIIGCGSIGSIVADSLKYYGVNNYILVDNQLLRHENIARHSLGYFWVDCNKANALGISLQKHNPNISCEVFEENAHRFIENRLEKINGCDVLIVAVADTPLEYHINEFKLEDKIKIPIIMIWVEPYMLGGHAVYIKKPQNVFNEVFDKNTLEFKFPVVKDGIRFLKREAGCQTTYMPYSAFLMNQFVYRVLEHILDSLWEDEKNYLITWCGNINSNVTDCEISELYKGKDDFSIVTRRID